MAEILIKGMEMPSERIMLEVFPDGKVYEIHPTNNARIPTEAEAIELPPHDDCPLVEISLERDTPKAPVLKDGESLVHLSKADGTGEFRSSKWLHWTCPVCGGFVGELYVYEGVRHIQRNTPYCAQCGQKIDWDTPRNEIR